MLFLDEFGEFSARVLETLARLQTVPASALPSDVDASRGSAQLDPPNPGIVALLVRAGVDSLAANDPRALRRVLAALGT